ncbi:hypothetical protein ACFW2V_12850 [Streptomyces sp. NPDC058947]|uniref:hypothetical protein n=1 Tax=Streptomyces sp. NPDC058947 TaxID=3346675 RepID=UPI00369A9D85
MRVSVRVDVTTREGGNYYTGTSDVLRHVRMWIEDGLSDRDDLVEVEVTEMPPPAPKVTLAELVEDAFAQRSTECPSCGDGSHPAAPCKCGHDFHGHGSLGMGTRRRCLNCRCSDYQESQDYPRCGAWGGCPMPLGHNRGHSDQPERHRAPSAVLSKPDHPAAHALAQYIASHPVSTVMAACRYLGWKLDFDLVPDRCPQCGDSGACNGGPCPLLDEPSTGLCITCQGRIAWVDEPEVGRWSHLDDTSGHEAQPAYCGCPAPPFLRDGRPIVNCVMHGKHGVHRNAEGDTWTTEGSI